MEYSVLIFEDNDGLRAGLEDLVLLSGEFKLVGAYNNAVGAADLVHDARPDVVLMDIDMPQVNGIEAVKQIRKRNKKVYIIMLTVFDDNNNVFDAICAGASGYLLKKDVSEKLISSIKEVINGGAPMSPSVAKMVIASMQRRSSETEYGFTNREKDILSSLCKGNSYKMIADELGISFETVRTYIKKIYDKLQVHSATEAVSKAINEGLV